MQDIDQAQTPDIRELDRAEAADRLALHLSRVLERSLASVSDKNRVDIGVALVRSLIEQIDRTIKKSDSLPERPADPAQILTALLGHRPDGSLDPLEPPLTPLLDTTLLTNAPGEPRVGAQVLTEIDSTNRIDVIMAFIRRSGIRSLVDALRRHCERKGEVAPLRILTTTYIQS